MSITKNQFDVDPELFRGFLDDSLESLASLEPIFVHLEADPNDIDVVDQVFRPVHSIKGNAGFFKLTATNSFAHRLETLLDKIRKRELAADHSVVELLLEGVDELKSMLTRISDNQDEVADEARLEQMCKQLDKAVESYNIEEYCRLLNERILHLAPLARQAKLDETHPEILLEIEMLSELNLAYTKQSGGDQTGNQSNRPAEAQIAVSSADTNYFLVNTDITREIRTLEKVLAQPIPEKLDRESAAQVEKTLNELEQKLDGQAAEIAAAMLDDYHTMLNSAVGFDDLLRELLAEKLGQMKTHFSTQPAPEPEPAKSAAKSTADTKKTESPRSSATPARTSRTMRVAEDKIDSFMKYVGELIMVGDSLNFLQHNLENNSNVEWINKKFHQINKTFRSLSDQLQKSLLEIRKVPASSLLQRIPRMVRDLAEKLEKKATVEVAGEDILIDKTLLEALNDPLTHLVRNCLDHGIEAPAQRRQANKPDAGSIKVTLREEHEHIILSINDDGKGIDPDIIRAKAIDKGLLKPENADILDQQQLLRFIFAPGFSTAAQVSDVSGRGVGMDVVRTNVENLNGTIRIDSKLGRGTQIQLKIPANTTVVVVSCMLVGIGPSYFLIPLDKIVEMIRPDSSALTTVQNCGEVLNIRKRLYPLLRLHKIFDMKPDHLEPSRGMVALVEANHQSAALLLDEVYGQQRVIIKKLPEALADLKGISGISPLGDGRIGIVLDVPELIGQYLSPAG